MNRQALFERSIDVLAQAFFDGTLKHGDPCACAIGNLIAAEIGANTDADYASEWPDHSSGTSWYDVLVTFKAKKDMGIAPEDEEIAQPLGYSNAEILKIEEAFEDTLFNDQFQGLMNVLDVLFEIHEIEDEGVRRDSREAFVKA